MLPGKLKNFNVWVNGTPHTNEALEITLPTLEMKTEEYRGGGMNGAVEIDMGTEKLEMEVTYGGFMDAMFNGFGASRIDSELIRFAGAYQHDDTGNVDAVEVVVRGRHRQIDPGSGKGGDDTEFKVASALSYYKLVVNGTTKVEIDHVNFVFNVNGDDRLAAQRAAIGL